MKKLSCPPRVGDEDFGVVSRRERRLKVKGIQPRNCPFETSDGEMRDTMGACHVSDAL